MTLKPSMLLSRFNTLAEQLKVEKRTAFMPFTLLGWPHAECSQDILQAMFSCDALELGFPFSDPAADGPLIQAAALEALQNGFTVDKGFEQLSWIRTQNSTIPISVLVYYNVVLSRGADCFFKCCAESGVDAVLIVDLPVEQVDEVKPAAEAHGVQLVFIVSPVTSPERMRRIVEVSSAYFYVVSRLGITGVNTDQDKHLGGVLEQLREQSELPCYVGFGISNPQHARHVLDLGADGVITGSKVIQTVQEARSNNRSVARALLELFDRMKRA
jgi:tryptophan synthase alpha chain